jgi:hypothetical protein
MRLRFEEAVYLMRVLQGSNTVVLPAGDFRLELKTVCP